MIRLRNIEKSFSHGPARTYVLRRIDCDIQQGEFVSIMGPSGAGKSTVTPHPRDARSILVGRILFR